MDEVDAEIYRLTKRVPKTQAEKNFYNWLLSWKEKQQRQLPHQQNSPARSRE
jgi:hypothetical protein